MRRRQERDLLPEESLRYQQARDRVEQILGAVAAPRLERVATALERLHAIEDLIPGFKKEVRRMRDKE
jgi:hypothetical protein